MVTARATSSVGVGARLAEHGAWPTPGSATQPPREGAMSGSPGPGGARGDAWLRGWNEKRARSERRLPGLERCGHLSRVAGDPQPGRSRCAAVGSAVCGRLSRMSYGGRG